MKSKEFKELLEQVSRLSSKQRTSLRQALEASLQDKPEAVREIEARMGNDPVCPHCGSHRIGKWGSAKGLRRFRCHVCGRTFNALTGTPLAHLRKKERWDQFAACLQESKTVRGSAEECGVHRNTTFRWRHRFLAWISVNKPPVPAWRGRGGRDLLPGISEREPSPEPKAEKARWQGFSARTVQGTYLRPGGAGP